MTPRMVVFDLGGVVVRICRSWREACDAAGVAYDDRAVTPEAVAARKPIRHAHEIGAMDDASFYLAVADTTDGVHTPDDIRRIHEAWILHEYRGVGALIDRLHAIGVRTGVLSNTNAAHWRQLVSGAHGPAKFPSVEKARHVYASHLLGLAKPDPAIYARFESLADAAADGIIFFDDLPDNVAGAAACGWDAVPIDHTGDTAEQMRLHLRLRGIDA